MKINWSIRAYLSLLVLAVALPFVGLLIYSIASEAQNNRRQASATSLSLAQLVAAQLEQFLADAENISAKLGSRRILRAMDPNRRDPIFDEFLEFYPQFANLVVADPSGRIIHSALPAPAEKSLSDVHAEWVQHTLHSNRFSVSKPILGKISRKWVSVVASPIKDADGRHIGALGLPVDLARILTTFKSVQLPPGAVITIVDAAGTVVARSLQPYYWVGRDARTLEVVNLTLTQDEGQAVARGMDGEERVYGFTAIPHAGWHVYAGIPTQIAFARARAATLRSSVVAVLILGLVATLVRALSRGISQPVRELSLATEAATRGQLDTRLPARGPAEIALVAQQFNQMLVARSQAELALNWSRERTRAVVESALDCIITIDPSGKIAEFNSAAERTFGYKREEAVGKDLAELIIPAPMRAGHRRGMATYLSTGQGPLFGKRIELTATRADGVEFPVELTVTRLGTQEPPLFTGFIRDITERKQTERRDAAFAKLGQQLNSAGSPEEAARVIVGIADELFGWDACTLDAYSAEEDLVYPVLNIDTIDGKRVDVPPAIARQPPTAKGRKVVNEGGQLVLREAPYDFPEGSIPFGDKSRASASVMTVPIRHAQKITGLLSIQSYKPAAYQPEQLRALQSLADLCGGALERVRAETLFRKLNEELERRVTERTAALQAANQDLEHEIALRNKVEAALRSHRRELQDYIDSMSTMNSKVALDGKMLLVNKIAQRASGLPMETLMKTNFLEGQWWTFDSQVQARVRQAFAKACAGTPVNYDEKLYVFDKVIDINFSLVPVFGMDGRVAYIIAEGRDITELKRTEAALEHERYILHTLMENAPDRIYFKDRESHFIRNNRASLKRFGLQDVAQVVGKTDFDFFTEEHARQAHDDEQQIIRAGQPINKEEKETWPDGHVTWALTTKLPLRNEKGEIVGTFGISRDITARKRAEAELQERTAQLEAANKELEAFSYSVSHDLRAPLRAIDGFSLALLEDCGEELSAEAKGNLQRVRASTQRMGQLIDDLLNLSRITRIDMNRETVDLSAIARGVADDLQRSAPGRQVIFDIQPQLVVSGDERLLRIAVDNLLSNAWKFSRNANPARIAFGGTDRDNQTAYFVRDNGAGFDMSYVNKLFGAFQRLHPAAEYEGTGIGLATVQRIVHRHGGRVWAEGEPAKGATFYFTLQPKDASAGA